MFAQRPLDDGVASPFGLGKRMSFFQKDRLGHCRLFHAGVATPGQRDIVGFEQKLLPHAGAKLRDESDGQINYSRASCWEYIFHWQLHRAEENAGSSFATRIEQVRQNHSFRNIGHHYRERALVGRAIEVRPHGKSASY